MESEFSKRLREERIAASQFKEGGFVAIINHHWDRRIEGKRAIAKVHKNGNFTLAGSPTQYRPSSDGKMAYHTGEPGFGRRDHLEPWSPAIEAEVVALRMRRQLEARRDAAIAALKELKGEALKVETIEAVELALGLTEAPNIHHD